MPDFFLNSLIFILQAKIFYRIDLEEKYNSLSEEAHGKTKKMKKVWNMLCTAKSELSDLTIEHQREIEGLLGSIRQLKSELLLQLLIIGAFFSSFKSIYCFFSSSTFK